MAFILDFAGMGSLFAAKGEEALMSFVYLNTRVDRVCLRRLWEEVAIFGYKNSI